MKGREGPREEEKEDEEDGQGVNKLKEMELGGRKGGRIATQSVSDAPVKRK